MSGLSAAKFFPLDHPERKRLCPLRAVPKFDYARIKRGQLIVRRGDVLKPRSIALTLLALLIFVPIMGMCWSYRTWAYADYSATKGKDEIMDPEWEFKLTRKKTHDWLPGASEYEVPITEPQYKQLQAIAVREEEVDGSGWWITIYF